MRRTEQGRRSIIYIMHNYCKLLKTGNEKKLLSRHYNTIYTSFSLIQKRVRVAYEIKFMFY